MTRGLAPGGADAAVIGASETVAGLITDRLAVAHAIDTGSLAIDGTDTAGRPGRFERKAEQQNSMQRLLVNLHIKTGRIAQRLAQLSASAVAEGTVGSLRRENGGITKVSQLRLEPRSPRPHPPSGTH